MPRRNHAQVNLPAGPNASWTDMLPPTPPPSSPPSPPRRRPRATPSMLLRMQNIRSTLADIKLSLDARQHISLLHENNGVYCLSCSPSEDLPGTCGPTCPLLCPHDRSSQFRGTGDSYAWIRRFEGDRATWRGIGGEMDRLGMSVYASTVSRWEREVEKLRGECEAPTEVHEREGWRPILPSRRIKEVSFEGWSFEGAWGKGPGVEMKVPPEMVVRGVGGEGRKRARW